MEIKPITMWNENIKGNYCIVNSDGTVHADGFQTYYDAEDHLALCLLGDNKKEGAINCWK